jgi:hypothetical protein
MKSYDAHFSAAPQLTLTRLRAVVKKLELPASFGTLANCVVSYGLITYLALIPSHFWPVCHRPAVQSVCDRNVHERKAGKGKEGPFSKEFRPHKRLRNRAKA